MTYDPVFTLDAKTWPPALDEARRAAALEALESGLVVYAPKLAFPLEPAECALMDQDLSSGKRKNISLSPSGDLGGAEVDEAQAVALKAMIGRFSLAAEGLLLAIAPGYAGKLERARTSYRPSEIAGRTYSPRKDDTRLHVDAFPSRPTGGRRILRLFTNINPHGVGRHWRIGEPFEAMARTLAPRVKPASPQTAALMQALKLTKGRRTAYDHLMLGLHDGAKLDPDYQARAPRTDFTFPPGSTWLCFTDQVMHAALSGQYVLEQTFHLDVAAMADPDRSPLATLERITGKALV